MSFEKILQIILFVIHVKYAVLLEEMSTGMTNTYNLSSTIESTTIKSTAPTFTTKSTDKTSCDTNDSSCNTVTKRSTVATPFTTIGLKSTTATPSTTTAPYFRTEIFQGFNLGVCTCDLQRKFCDINCCCDTDCSFENKKVFRNCKREFNLHRDTSFCQYMDYIYLNNTPYKWEVNQNGLFCIAKTNLPPRYTIQRKQPIESLDEAKQQKENRFSWPDTETQYDVNFNTNQSFVYGSDIWIIRNNFLELFQLPNSFVTNACLMNQNIKFLNNYKAKCSQTWIDENNPNLNSENYFKNISFLRAPRYFNTSLFKNNFQNCSKNVCIPIKTKICDDNFDNCFNASATNESLSVSCHLNIRTNENSCLNLVEKVKYNLYHNGTEGFTRIELFLILKNLSYYFGDENYEFLQQYEVNCFWSNYTFNYTFLLSGNPGYLISKPILMGNIIFVNKTNKNGNVTYQQIKRNSLDVSDIFLIIPSSKKGLCGLTNHSNIPVEFGYNMIAKCKIQRIFEFVNKNLTASDLCRNLQNVIFDYWPIFKSNLSSINRVVGNFGNSNESVLTDWTRILSNKSPNQILNETVGNFTHNNTTLLCSNMITNLKIDIFHARVDFKDLRNQEKIFGTAYNFGNGKKIKFNLNKNKIFFEVVIKEEIMFFDITSERIQKFVDPPSFKITLPYDFFYPFVKVGNKGTCLSVCNILIILSLILVSLRKKICTF